MFEEAIARGAGRDVADKVLKKIWKKHNFS